MFDSNLVSSLQKMFFVVFHSKTLPPIPQAVIFFFWSIVILSISTDSAKIVRELIACFVM